MLLVYLARRKNSVSNTFSRASGRLESVNGKDGAGILKAMTQYS
jgi:hypothetical protein